MSIPRHWRLQRQRYWLAGDTCEKCGARILPARDVCPECQAPAKTPFVFSGRGTIYSYSIVYHPPRGFEEFAPYIVALVQLEEGPMVVSQLTDVDAAQVEIGMPVEMVTRKLHGGGERGTISYGYKFRPTLEHA